VIHAASLPHDRARRLALALSSVAAVATFAGCAAAPPVVAPTPASEPAGPRPFLAPLQLTDDPWPDAIVRVVGDVSCSGALIASDLVLTAHHCVAARDATGQPLERDLRPEKLRIELGGDDLPWGEVEVRAIVSAPIGFRRGPGDVTLLVLDRPLRGMPTLAPRLFGPPRIGERLASWGFGRCALARDAVRRHARAGGLVDAVEPGAFYARASVCPGDSGGPVLSPDREIVGVVSAAVMDTSPTTRDLAEFARIDVLRDLFSVAREIADGRSPSETPPLVECGGLACAGPALVTSRQ
jgi:hypothetical protein